ASNPRFVETLARRGYRFIAPVQVDGTPIAAESAVTVESKSADVGYPPQAGHLHPELQVPLPRRAITRGLFALVQMMYLIFYLVVLWKWERIDELAGTILLQAVASAIVVVFWITALIGIPLRLYLMSAVAFDHRRFGENFRCLFLLILLLDQLWATVLFLLILQIGTGLVFAVIVALLYV